MIDKIVPILQLKYSTALQSATTDYERGVATGLLIALGTISTVRELAAGNFADPDSVDPDRVYRNILEREDQAVPG
jgi:hypothetical protein